MAQFHAANMGITKSMSEAKNTALGSSTGFGYSHVSPTKHHLPLSHQPITMISLTFVLAALVLFISWDSSEAQNHE